MANWEGMCIVCWKSSSLVNQQNKEACVVLTGGGGGEVLKEISEIFPISLFRGAECHCLCGLSCGPSGHCSRLSNSDLRNCTAGIGNILGCNKALEFEGGVS